MMHLASTPQISTTHPQDSPLKCSILSSRGTSATQLEPDQFWKSNRHLPALIYSSKENSTVTIPIVRDGSPITSITSINRS